MPCIYIYYKPDAGECKLLGRSASHKKSANRRVRNVSALTRWDMRWDKRKLLLSPHRIANLTVTYFVIKYRKWNAIMHGNLSVTSVIGKPMHSVHSPILHISICMYYAPFHSTSATSVASSMSTGCRKCNSQTPSNIVTQWIEQLQFSQTPNRLFVWCCRLVVAQQRDDDHQTMFVFCYFLGMTVRWEAICWYMAGRVEIETSIQDDMRWSVELQLSDYRYVGCAPFSMDNETGWPNPCHWTFIMLFYTVISINLTGYQQQCSKCQRIRGDSATHAEYQFIVAFHEKWCGALSNCWIQRWIGECIIWIWKHVVVHNAIEKHSLTSIRLSTSINKNEIKQCITSSRKTVIWWCSVCLFNGIG